MSFPREVSEVKFIDKYETAYNTHYFNAKSKM